MNNDVISYLVKLVGEGKISNLSIESSYDECLSDDYEKVCFDINRVDGQK